MFEVKFGFIPNSQDTTAWRVRRRYRLSKGGIPQLALVHYTRGQQTCTCLRCIAFNGLPKGFSFFPPLFSLSLWHTAILPALLAQPVRSYPLRPLNEPPVFVLGDKNRMAYPQGGVSQPPPPPAPQTPQTMVGMNPNMNLHMSPQAMLAQQNANMSALERRSQRERARERSESMAAVRL